MRWKALFIFPLVCCGCGANFGSEAAQAPAAVIAKAEASSEMPSQLVKHLRGKYPNLEGRFLKAVCSLEGKYPGLAYSLPRHLIEDLEGEPALALRDVAEAERQAYPNLPSRVRELRQSRPTAELVASRYPKLRTQFLEAVETPLPGQLRSSATATIHKQFPQLPRQVALEVSREADDNFPGLALEMIRNRGQERPLAWLAKNHPEFLRAVAGRVMAQKGPQLRQAAVAVLSAWEQDPGCQVGPRVARAVDFLNANYPTLLAEVLDQRMAARRSLRAEFPQMGAIALQTLVTKHPQLIGKALSSVQTHYPNLRADFQQALETELPGIRQEARAFLQANYPDIAARLPQ